MSLLSVLRAERRLAATAAFPFDFDVDADEHVEEVHLASGEALDPIGGDAGGGTYFLCGDAGGEQRPVLYADSEGSAGLIAVDLRSAFELMFSRLAWEAYAYTEDHGVSPEDLVAEAEREAAEDEGLFRADFPDVDQQAASETLLAGLGLRRVPPAELISRSLACAAFERANPGFRLLNSAEGVAYQRL